MVFTVDTMIAMYIKTTMNLSARSFQLSVAAKNGWQTGQTDVDTTPEKLNQESNQLETIRKSLCALRVDIGQARMDPSRITEKMIPLESRKIRPTKTTATEPDCSSLSP
jgi:hypothetical protein